MVKKADEDDLYLLHKHASAVRDRYKEMAARNQFLNPRLYRYFLGVIKGLELYREIWDVVSERRYLKELEQEKYPYAQITETPSDH